MHKTRLEAFSDGVFAIIITIRVLELKVPESTEWEVIKHLVPIFFCYVLSFVYVAIYWNNHHHLMSTAKGINAGIMWANMHLLFWLSMVPFATGWMGVNKFHKIPVAIYGVVLILCGLAYTILAGAIKRTYTQETPLTMAIAKDNVKGYLSSAVYCVGIIIALFLSPLVSCVLYAAVAVMWIIPSKHIERALQEA